MIVFFLIPFTTYAHTALMSCHDNGDGYITCEGGFSDGSSASGVSFKIIQNGQVLIEGTFDEESTYTFAKPQGNYEAHFDAGEGHRVTVKSSDIAE